MAGMGQCMAYSTSKANEKICSNSKHYERGIVHGGDNVIGKLQERCASEMLMQEEDSIPEAGSFSTSEVMASLPDSWASFLVQGGS